MKIIDKNGRLFGFLNILDLIVLILIVGAVLSLAYRLTDNETANLLGGNDTFYITFRTERVRDFSVAAVNVDDVIYEQFAQKLGTIVKVWTDIPHETVSLNDGTAEYFPMEDRFDLYFTIEATGTVNSGGYYVNGNNLLSAGKDIKIQSNMIYTTAKVYSVSTEKP